MTDFDDWVTYWSKRIAEAWVKHDAEEEEWLRLQMQNGLGATHKLQVKRLDYKAGTPTRATEKSAGLDLYAAESVFINPVSQETIGTGVSVSFPPGTVGMIWPRSGLAARHGVDVMAGVVDEDYTGEIKVILRNHGVRAVSIAVGDRIAQLVIQPYLRPQIEVVDSLAETARSDGGFGSSGV